MLKIESTETNIIISLDLTSFINKNYIDDSYFNKLIKIVIQFITICNIESSVKIEKNGF